MVSKFQLKLFLGFYVKFFPATPIKHQKALLKIFKYFSYFYFYQMFNKLYLINIQNWYNIYVFKCKTRDFIKNRLITIFLSLNFNN